MKNLNIEKLIQASTCEKDHQFIQDLLSPEAREKFNLFAAKLLAKKGLLK